MAERFELEPEGPFSLAASARFLEGFAPAAYEGEGRGRLRFAFVTDGLADGERVAGVLVQQEGETVIGEVHGEADVEVVRRQVSRILSLDVDGSGFPGVAERDPVVSRLQRRYPGLRPMCFYSPYEAAAWAIVGHRTRITQAARVKARMAEELGPEVEMDGRVEHAFPGPSRLAGLETFPGLTGTKIERLRHLARSRTGGSRSRPPTLAPRRGGPLAAAGVARHRPLLRRTRTDARRGRARPSAGARAAPGTGRRENLWVGRDAGRQGKREDQRKLASVPNLGGAAPAGRAGRRDRRDRRKWVNPDQEP